MEKVRGKVRSGLFRIFIAPEELTLLLNNMRSDERVAYILQSFDSTSAQILLATDDLQLNQPLDRIIVVSGSEIPTHLNPARLSILPFQEGWVSFDASLHRDNVLYMTQLSFRSGVHSAQLLFNRLQRRLIRGSTKGVVVVDLPSGTQGMLPGVYYSPGAKALADAGVIWKQYGVKTQEFRPIDIPPP